MVITQLIMLIKIQSISDIITNSSTQVFTLYNRGDLITIKNIVNAIMTIDSDHTFDDFFEIKLLLDEYVIEDLYDNSDELQEQFPTINDFWDHLNDLSEDELEEYEDMWDDFRHYESYPTIYEGYAVSLKEGVEGTPKILDAMRVINSFDTIFNHDCSYC